MELMSAVLERGNMMRAYERVLQNKGAAGVDGIMVGDLKSHLKAHWPEVREQLREGRYCPLAVRKVEIPKPGGGKRMLVTPKIIVTNKMDTTTILTQGGTVCPVVWEDGGSNPASYPMKQELC